MNASTTASLISDWTASIGDILVASLPAIFVIAAAVFGLTLLVRFGKRFIGGR